MKNKKYKSGEYVCIILDPLYMGHVSMEDILGISGKEYQIIEALLRADIEEYEYLLRGINVWIPEHCLLKKSEIKEAIPYQEIALLEKQIDKALEERKEEKFKELSKKYALLKADYV